MIRRAQHLFVVALAAGATATLPATSLAAPESGTRMSARAGSIQVVQGTHVTLRVPVRRAGVVCRLVVRYADGRQQSGLRAARSRAGAVSWRWLVPETAAVGSARATVTCAGAVRRASFTVLAKPIPARIVVEQRGFSLRVRSTMSLVSYGLVLRNESPVKDALDVTVLVNFVTADNVLVGSATTRVAAIGAGATYYLGNMLSFTGVPAVDHLEPVITVKASAPKALHLPPLHDVRVLPSPFEPAWVGSVEGQVLNDHGTKVLGSSGLSAVFFDAAGNVVGGGTGVSGAALPPGERVFFKATTGVNAVPVEKVASVQVSVEPRFTNPES